MKNVTRITWLIVGLWFVVGVLTLDYNGPFFDEGIYITGGLRALEGYGRSDGYLNWFAGSLLWPILAGLGYRAAGLLGTRAVALVLGTLAFAASVRASRNLFGPHAGLWTAIVFAVSGPFMALARLGVYDVLALAGVAVSFWAATELWKRDHRGWLVVSALGFTVAMFAKYPIGLMLLPLCGVILILRRRRAVADIVIFGLISSAVTLAFYLPARDQIAPFFSWRVANTPKFDVTLAMIAFSLLLLSVVPAVLAFDGWLLAGERRGLATVLLLSLGAWPAYHLLAQDPSSSSKHVVFGYLLAFPLVGFALSRLWADRQPITWLRKAAIVTLVLLLAAYGVVQLYQSNRAWPDVRPPAAYLVDHVNPGERLLINESWPYTMYLYSAGRIESPWDVFDVYRITHGESEIGLCEYAWFVDTQGSYTWPDAVREGVAACGSFEPVFSASSTVMALGSDLKFVSYPVHTTIWRNTAGR